ncbi:hypothetical protein BDV96DRAFT_640400 [Lophiotrema nucula]|uniref:Uncharacterized protein n=1 Tax=Lophiotrema nucula TaxID=690887 RepID=A0A6A5ZTF2_9PLEO|nr:hypothetical protein BDV96DRAFT_640400 [Lophiotrema nucula]
MASAIPELQAAFGTILQLEKSKPKALAPTETYPKWMGSFRLFDFPRELRDRIYQYALYRPKGYVYSRSRSYPWKERDETHINLYLTSRHVYAEALEVFCRHNALEIAYKTRLAGTLRLFPERPARLLQRVRLHYQQGSWRNEWPRTSPSGCFAQMMIESRVAKSFFPLLRECTAVWTVSTWAFEREEHLNFSNITHNDSVSLLLDWMQRYYYVDRLVPPSYLKVEMTQYYHVPPEIEALERTFAEALEAFKVWGREVEREIVVDPEAEGRKWIEEAFAATPSKRGKVRK